MSSILIDSITRENNREEINGKWYIAKPIFATSLRGKLTWCLEILRGKAIAVHYKRDE